MLSSFWIIVTFQADITFFEESENNLRMILLFDVLRTTVRLAAKFVLSTLLKTPSV